MSPSRTVKEIQQRIEENETTLKNLKAELDLAVDRQKEESLATEFDQMALLLRTGKAWIESDLRYRRNGWCKIRKCRGQDNSYFTVELVTTR